MDVFMTDEASYVGHHPYNNNNAYNVDDFVVTGLKAFNNLKEYYDKNGLLSVGCSWNRSDCSSEFLPVREGERML